MKFFKDCWITLLEVFNAISGIPTDGTQRSLGVGLWRSGHGETPHYPPSPKKPTPPSVFEPPGFGQTPGSTIASTNATPPSVFQPPGIANTSNPRILCDYTAMGPGWSGCSTSSNRGCWLKGPNKTYGIDTDYEVDKPKGVTRKYVLYAGNMTINADGENMTDGKVFNKTYPGPWIQACWGDDVEIKVVNNLKFNGTTVHWHGIRMLDSFEHDGVNAVTQCPIAPGDHFTYKFSTLQYGTSWYHSHYSLQYGDGMLGPLTIFGPSTGDFDEPVDPILMTDWNHESGFKHFQSELMGIVPKMDSILLNGKGSYAGTGMHGEKYNTTFEYGKRYLLRLINTSVDTTFVFSIDNHNLTVISADFVPIHKYSVDHIVIGIGQRYHVIVEAKPYRRDNSSIIIPESESKTYWIRTIPAEKCHNFMRGNIPDERQGILYYANGNKSTPRTERGTFPIACRDELYEQLKPYRVWNISLQHKEKGFLSRDPFEVGIDKPTGDKARPMANDSFFRWSMGKTPMFLNFSDPTINNLHKNASSFLPEKVVIPENYTENSWVYMIITGNITKGEQQHVGREFPPAAHPMHLHGHDFALLQQSTETWERCKFNPKIDNPPRRDVVLLPQSGFIVIAFKADNPGAWAFHCHIAWHASSGLVIQVLERQDAILKQLAEKPERLDETKRTCKNWEKWFSNPNNFWDPHGGKEHFQDDSGV